MGIAQLIGLSEITGKLKRVKKLFSISKRQGTKSTNPVAFSQLLRRKIL